MAATTCVSCGQHPATVCDECRRDLAFRAWWGISRHPESGTDCTLCEAGPPSLCGLCLIAAIPEHRAMVRANGYPVSQWPPSDPDHQKEVVQGLRAAVSTVRAAATPEDGLTAVEALADRLDPAGW